MDTGADTPTGGRLRQAADAPRRRPTFCATYADGVADVDLRRLLDFHAAHDGAATMTVVRPELQFGVTELDGDGASAAFDEKPRSEHWINGGFFCFEPRGARPSSAEASVLEREPLEAAGRRRRAARLPPRGLLGLHGHLQGRRCVLNDLWASRRTAMEGRGADGWPYGDGRSTFVTGAYGMLGVWLVRALLDRRGERVVVLRRDRAVQRLVSDIAVYDVTPRLRKALPTRSRARRGPAARTNRTPAPARRR